MDNVIQKIARQIEQESATYLDWFFEHHICVVAENVNWLCDNLPEADRKICLLGAYLHDLQRLRHIDGDHEKVGAEEAGKILIEYNYDEKIIQQVQKTVLTHSGKDGNLPQDLESWVLCAADGMAHFQHDFMIRIALLGQRDLENYKNWCRRKIERNWNNKIHFDFAKEKMRGTYETTRKFFEL